MGPAWRRNYIRYKRLFLNFFSTYKDRQDVKMFLEVLLSLATISLFSIAALRPTIITITELIKEIETKKEIVEKMDNKIETLTQAQSLYDQEISRIRLLETSIPDEPHPDAFLRQLEGLLAKHSNSPNSINLKETVLLGASAPKGLAKAGEEQVVAEEIPFSINTTADYQLLYSFLYDIEKLRRPISFITVNLNTVETTETKSLILSIEGLTPFMKKTK